MQNIHKMSETTILPILVLTPNVLLLNKRHKNIFGLIFFPLFYHVVLLQSTQLLSQVSPIFLYSTENNQCSKREQEHHGKEKEKVILLVSVILLLEFILNLTATMLQELHSNPNMICTNNKSSICISKQDFTLMQKFWI